LQNSFQVQLKQDGCLLQIPRLAPTWVQFSHMPYDMAVELYLRTPTWVHGRVLSSFEQGLGRR
jgi:hypothetical protein